MKKIRALLKSKHAIIFILVIISTFIFIKTLNKRALPAIMNYASVQTKKIAIEVLRNTGLKEVNKKIKEEQIFEITKNKNGEIESIDFNTAMLNETLIIVAKSVRKKLKEVEQGKGLPDEMYSEFLDKKLKNGIIYEVPIGVAFKNSFLANVGPKIPVKVEYSGNVGLDVKTRVKSYGLNSALIEVYIYIEVTQSTILPFQSKSVKVTSEVPVVMKVIKGSIPNYLSGTNESYSLPID